MEDKLARIASALEKIAQLLSEHQNFGSDIVMKLDDIDGVLTGGLAAINSTLENDL